MSVPTLYISKEAKLPDNNQWTNRFQIKSQTSNRVYIIAQNIVKRHWGCDCPAWRTRRYCKHLNALALPTHEKPYEVKIAN